VDGLRRLREPAAFAVLAVLLLQVLITWIEYVAYGSVSLRTPETLTILVLGLIVASCVVGERTVHARILTVLAVMGSALSILTSVTLAIIAPTTGPESTVIVWLDLLLDLVVPVLVILGLAKLPTRQSPAQQAIAQSPAITDAEPTDPGPAALPSSQLEPVWQPDAASGVAWQTAGDAAVGAPASGWGTPGEASGWQPNPDDENPSPGDRSHPES
jgi:hypothetical protein